MPSHCRYSLNMLKFKSKHISKWNKHLFEETSDGTTTQSEIVRTIMSKNIFRDNDLEKVMPDYSPTTLMHRMELRSSMVRPICARSARRNVFKSKCQRDKSIQDISNVSKELVNMKSGLNLDILRNKIMLKNVVHRKILKPINKQLLEKEIDLTFIDSEISMISELENCLNSEREILCDTNHFQEPDKYMPSEESKERAKKRDSDDYGENINNLEFVEKNHPKTITTVNERNGIIECHDNHELEHKSVVNSDDIADLDSALSLMTLYSHSKILPAEIQDGRRDEEFTDTDRKVEINLPAKQNVEDDECLRICSLSNIAKEKYLIKKYTWKWKKFVSSKKEMSEFRKKKIDDFFERLMKQKIDLNTKENQDKEPKNKAHTFALDQKRYQHRYNVQKNIIALQKMKLDEQNRIIEELKYNKIIEATKESSESMRETVKNTYLDMDRRMKPKIKCLSNELKIQDIEAPALVLHCLKVPKFLQSMEKRAREREEKHAMIRERKKQIEEERLRLKQQDGRSKNEE